MSDRARLAAARLLADVLPARGGGASLREALARQQGLDGAERGLVTDLAYGVCRHQRLLAHWLDRQLTKPLRPAAWPVRMALLAGLYELWFSQRPAYAVVNAWPEVCRGLRAPWAAGLTNAVLRKASRCGAPPLDALPLPVRHSLPDWLWTRLQESWPDRAEALAAVLATPAPLTLRLRPGRDAAALDGFARAGLEVRRGELAPLAVTLDQARPVHELPGFAEGLFLVQDEAAQLPAELIEAPPQGRILDACAAPGGKTAQLADRFPGARLVALDLEPHRLARVRENCARLGIAPALVAGDATAPASWWDGEPFDAVLVDAPCSATGILRRQPDVKWHRRASDITTVCGLQSRMLDAIWPLVRPGGVLVYATCSILPEENADQVRSFLDRHGDAREDTPRYRQAVGDGPGCQLLPRQDGHDGFYFARIRKGG